MASLDYFMSGSREIGRVASGAAPAPPSAVGPPRPARRSKSGDSGERVTEPVARERPPTTGPVRLAQCSLMNNPG
jgi:hypothetical protein